MHFQHPSFVYSPKESASGSAHIMRAMLPVHLFVEGGIILSAAPPFPARSECAVSQQVGRGRDSKPASLP